MLEKEQIFNMQNIDKGGTSEEPTINLGIDLNQAQEHVGSDTFGQVKDHLSASGEADTPLEPDQEGEQREYNQPPTKLEESDKSNKSAAQSENPSLQKKSTINLLDLDIQDSLIDLSMNTSNTGVSPQEREANAAKLRQSIDHLATLRQRAASELGEGIKTQQLDQHIAFYEELYSNLINRNRQAPVSVKEADKDPIRAEEYIEELAMGGYLEDRHIGPVMDMVRKPEVIPGLLDEQLQRLQQYRVHPVNSDKHNIAEAWGIIRRKLYGQENNLTAANGMVMLFGSMIYDDPKNLDYDLASLVYTKMKPEREQLLIDSIKYRDESISDIWPFGSAGAISYVHMPTLYRRARAVTNLKFPVRNIDEYLIDATHGSTLLTGLPLIQTSKKDLVTLQNELKIQAAQNPLLGAIMLNNLEKTEDVRKRRRGK